MTLGRTSSGAIKIKTDSAGGGLRAVNCECCGGGECGCYSVPISGKLLEIMLGTKDSTGITCNGVPPDKFFLTSEGFEALWDEYDKHGVPLTDFIFYRRCIFLYSFFTNELGLGPSEQIASDGTRVSCCYYPEAIPCIDGNDIAINGQPFPSFKQIFLPGSPEFTLNLVFA